MPPVVLKFFHQILLMLSESNYNAFGVKSLLYAQLNTVVMESDKKWKESCLEKIK